MRRPSTQALREAAAIAREEGVTVTVERLSSGGWVYRIGPGAQSYPIGATEREERQCDEAFGVSE